MKNKIGDYLDFSNKVILGKFQETKLSLCCLLSRGHLLIEDIPGVGKTTLAKFLCRSMGLSLSRIQFTNDLLPSDILGVNIYDRNTQEFSFKKGPIFGEVVLADELNRATPKTQSALLQAMEEYRVTVEGQTYDLPYPFFVIATQNPRNHIGVNPLPESQLDRFLMKIQLGFPDMEAEKELLLGQNRQLMIDEMKTLIPAEEIIQAQREAGRVHASGAVADYVLHLLKASRNGKGFKALSPRAGIDLLRAAKTWSYMEGRDSVIPEDIQAVAPAVLGHRLGTSDESVAGKESSLVQELISQVEVF